MKEGHVGVPPTIHRSRIATHQQKKSQVESKHEFSLRHVQIVSGVAFCGSEIKKHVEVS